MFPFVKLDLFLIYSNKKRYTYIYINKRLYVYSCMGGAELRNVDEKTMFELKMFRLFAYNMFCSDYIYIYIYHLSCFAFKPRVFKYKKHQKILMKFKGSLEAVCWQFQNCHRECAV